jgi:hypothetical protein
MRPAENVYFDCGGFCPMLGFPVSFPQFTQRRGCGITSGRITSPRSFFRTALDCSERRATQFRRKPGFRTLRYGPGVVATPTALDASKEDVGKGGASPAPLPKVLHVYSGKALLQISAGISASNNRGRAWTGDFFAERERIASGKL